MASEDNGLGMEWKECVLEGEDPLARAGHTAVAVSNGQKMVVYG